MTRFENKEREMTMLVQDVLVDAIREVNPNYKLPERAVWVDDGIPIVSTVHLLNSVAERTSRSEVIEQELWQVAQSMNDTLWPIIKEFTKKENMSLVFGVDATENFDTDLDVDFEFAVLIDEENVDQKDLLVVSFGAGTKPRVFEIEEQQWKRIVFFWNIGVYCQNCGNDDRFFFEFAGSDAICEKCRSKGEYFALFES